MISTRKLNGRSPWHGDAKIVLGIIPVSAKIFRTERDHRLGTKTCQSYISLLGDDMSVKICTEGHHGMENTKISLRNHSISTKIRLTECDGYDMI